MVINGVCYKMSFGSILKALLGPFIVFAVSVFLLFFLFIESSAKNEYISVSVISLLFVVLFFIPPLVLILNYYNNDKDMKLVIKHDVKMISISKGTKEDDILYNEIKRIERYQLNWFIRMSYRSMYYYKLILNDNRCYYFSRLLINDFEKKEKDLSFEECGVLFPIIQK